MAVFRIDDRLCLAAVMIDQLCQATRLVGSGPVIFGAVEDQSGCLDVLLRIEQRARSESFV